MPPRKSLAILFVIVLLGAGMGWAGGHDGDSLGPFRAFHVAVATAFIIQWTVFVPSFLAQTEHYYDLTGSLTYLTLISGALYAAETLDLRTGLLGGLCAVWAVRLGTFLFQRVKKAGKDGRFDEIKPAPLRFLVAWTIQGLWVIFTLAAALAAMTSGHKIEIGLIGIFGVVLWIIGFGIEVMADRQKSRFRARPENQDAFITGGLWAWSRHPNYFGEFLLWTGIAVLAAPALHGPQWLTLVSPVFVFLLLTRVSGVPLLEARADKKWGGQANYEAYKSRVPVFFPRRPRS